MTGYRTLIFAGIIGVAGIFGHHLAPDVVNGWLDAIFALTAASIAFMRWITTTPLGHAIPPEVAQVANLIAAATDKGSADLPAVDQPAAVAAPASGGATITGPPADLIGLATSITNALTTIQSVHAAMASSLQAASDQVSAALPSSPVPQPAPAAPAAAGQQ